MRIPYNNGGGPGNQRNNTATVTNEEGQEEGDIVLTMMEFAMTTTTNFATDHHLWCYNTGATSNMTPFVKGLYDIKKIDGNVKIRDGTGLMSTLIGKKDYIAKYRDGTMQSLMLTMKIVPNMQYNLISGLQAFDNG